MSYKSNNSGRMLISKLRPPPDQWVRVLFFRVKRSGRDADHSPPSGTELEIEEPYLHSFHISSWRGQGLYLHRHNDDNNSR